MSAILPVYRRSDIVIERGEGVYLFAPDGKRYLDFAAGIAVNALGHTHPHLVKALKKQADLLWHCSNMYRVPGLERLAERFVQHSFAEKVFFCNSGGEAVECGMKMVRKYFRNRESGIGNQRKKSDTRYPIPDTRYRIITMEGGFHGRTLACISAGGNAIAREGYEPLMDGFDRATFNDIQSVAAAITQETAAILVEPIQGEGGIHSATPEFLKGLRKLCDAHGLLLFIDEVQCGMGRTGTLFAHEQAGIMPDILATAKGIGNGFPLAACLATDNAASGMTPGSHGSTYGSNPLAMAVGNAVLNVMLAPGFFAHVQQMGAELKNGLEQLVKRFPKLLKDVRGQGLMLGLETHVPHMQMVEKLRAKKLLTAPAVANVIRIVPPLITQTPHIKEALEIIDKVCEEWV